ncbi:MAG: phospholipase D-like domain-containing protein [Candidatus Hydrogenedens sp.]|nr:phospholipase D-like domain-containing protein [Candidatus Hydrogenedens sp.]
MTIIYQLLVEHFFTVVGFLFAVFLILKIVSEHRRPGGAISWVVAILFAPYISVPLYFIFGGRKIAKKINRKEPLYATPSIKPEQPIKNPIERVLLSSGMPPIRRTHSVLFSFDGVEAYNRLIQIINEAKEYIYCTTFILGKDKTGLSIINALAEKAKQGIRVCLLLDSLGCLTVTKKTLAHLIQSGGEVGFFLPVLPLRRKWSANLRNHRKIVIVDGTIAMIGGMNLSDNFMGPVPSPKRFLDNTVFLKGEAIYDIEQVFRSDWYFTTEKELPEPKTDSFNTETNAHSLPGLVQVVASGPDVSEDTLYDAILTACMEAKERIWIVTPYFVPDEPILKALNLQARAGVDVSIIMPKHSNHRVADFARGPALRELLDSGANIWFYEKGMVHSKLLVFDRFLAVTGSPNLDIRSMYLNFEIALFHYSPNEIDAVAGWTYQLMNNSKKISSLSDNTYQIWLENLSLLIAPLI